MVQQIRNITYTDFIDNKFTENVSDVRFRTTSLLGTSKSGIPFVPKTYSKFKFNNKTEDTDSFEASYGTFNQNHQLFQGKNLPYLAAYATLEAGNQLNYTRLLGANLDSTLFPNLLPGFTLNSQNYKVFILSLTFNQSLMNNLFIKNHYNSNVLNTNKYYFATVITKNCEISQVEYNNPKNDFILNLTSTDNSFIDNTTIFYNKVTSKNVDIEKNKKIEFSFNPNSEFYWKETLNTNIHRLDDFGYCLYHFDDVLSNLYIDPIRIIKYSDITITSNVLANNIYKDFQQGYKYAESPWIVSQGYYSHLEITNREELKDRVKKLFKVHAISPGIIGNEIRIRISLNTLKNDEGFASFNLHVMNQMNESILDFANLNFNKNSPDFIARRIGTQKESYDFITQKVNKEGEYILKNHLIRIELSDDILNENFTKDTIPAGFLNYQNIRPNIINNNTLQHLSNAYVPSLNTQNNNKIVWGQNFYEYEFNLIRIPAFKTGFNNSSSDVKTIIKRNIEKKIVSSLKNNIYLNNNYFDTVISNDFFHLEKIILLNKIENNDIKQNWRYAKFNNILNISSITSSLDEFNIITNDFNPYYFYTITNRFVTKDMLQQDSIFEAKLQSNYENILDFAFELRGGWDGLNLLDINEYCINDKGLQQSNYLKQLYKLSFDIINEESNGQNELIYLPEIFNDDVINYICNQFEKNKYSLLILDKPFYDNTSQKIYSTDFLQHSAGSNNKLWNDFYFEYKGQIINNVPKYPPLPETDWDITLLQWQNSQKEISSIISSANYLWCQINNNNSTENILPNTIENNHIIPAGFIILYILNSYENRNINTMNPLYNTQLGNIAAFNILACVDDILNEAQIIDDINKNYFEKIKDLYINFLHTEYKFGQIQYKINADKTNIFGKSNNSLLSQVNVRNTLLNIKRKIKLLSYIFLFENVKDRVDLTNRMKVAYTLYLQLEKDKGSIEDFQIKLDDKTTSQEDILNNLVRGAIYLKFRSRNEMVKVNVNE